MMRFTLTTLLLFSVLFLGGCFRYGQALLRFEVTRDGEPVLESYRGVWDETPLDQMWDELDTLVFEPMPDRPASPIAGPNAKRAELTGDISISICRFHRWRWSGGARIRSGCSPTARRSACARRRRRNRRSHAHMGKRENHPLAHATRHAPLATRHSPRGTRHPPLHLSLQFPPCASC